MDRTRIAALHSRKLSSGVLALALALLTMGLRPDASFAAPCTPPVVNAVACENTLPGVPPSEWYVDGAGDESIQGFATQMSVAKGETISFKVDSETPNMHIDILRLGYYGGNGARMIASNLAPTGPTSQPECEKFADTGLIDCGNWSVTRSWTVPTNAVSGVYIANLVANTTGDMSQIIFVVRDDADPADIVLQTSDTTWQAYNDWGGNSLYRCTVACPPGEPYGYKAAYKVSYNRPLRTGPASAFFTGAEYAMVRFLEANGYDVTYVSGVDVHRDPSVLLNRKLFISSGHDEYWSATQRAAMENARDAGVNLAFFSGNEGFWKTRWEPSAAGPPAPNRTLVSYKDTHFTERQDPVEWTGTWRDSRFTTPEENIPENALTGQSFVVNSGTSRITVPYEFKNLRMWRNTAVTSLSPGQSLMLAPGTLGYEWDEDPDNGFRPAGSIRLSSTTVSNVEVFTDYGSSTRFDGTATHTMTMYRAPSGARVFGAGTVQWAWGLDSWNPDENPPDRNMQQATVNLLADLGAQPATLQPGLVPASKTTDETPPSSTITSAPSTVSFGAKVVLSGTAADTGGGVVAGVEISTDGGKTWKRASGTTNWTYTWTAAGAPQTTIKVRATDDSGNTETPGPGRTVAVTCPCSLWSNDVTPAVPDAGDPSSVEVGVKFRTDAYGTITGVRFYKSAANTGVHTGSVWTEDGQRLAQATFQNETASGWQTVTFAEPVVVEPGKIYIASYFAPNGHYAATPEYFYRDPSPGPNGGAHVDSPPLHAVRNTNGTVNGVFSYGSTSVFPTASYQAANYWVDVVFTPTPPPGQVTGVTATEGGISSANVTWNAPATGGAPSSYVIRPYVGGTPGTPKTVPGNVTSTTMTGLTTGTTYRFTVQATNPAGDGPESAPSNPVTPVGPVAPAPPTNVKAQPGTTSARVTWTASASDGDSPITSQIVIPYVNGQAQTPTVVAASATSATITGLVNGTEYTFRVKAINAIGSSPESAASNPVVPQTTIFDFTTPPGTAYNDHAPVELGVKFTVDFDGWITGVRFYKAPNDAGTHVGSLWTASGQRLAQATFTNETSSGWQSVVFSQPVQITAGTTYVASYLSPEGAYTATSGGLTSSVDAGPIQTVANSVSANGVYVYGPGGGFPTSSYEAANYWVDVLYALPTPGKPTAVAAEARGTSTARVSWSAPSNGGPTTSYRITPYISGIPQPQLAKTVAAPATSATVTGLTTGTTYTFRVEALNANGPGPLSDPSNPVTPAGAVEPSPPSNVRATPATGSVRVTWDLPASDGDSPITSQTITPYVGETAQEPVQVGPDTTAKTITGLENGTEYTFRVTATNAIGTSPPSPKSNAVTPAVTIFDFATPNVIDSGDGGAVELGVKFRSSFPGTIRGVRFYKAAGNTGTHTASLWTAGGTKLASATFTDESASGWQTVMFDEPVPVSPDTTYVASYHAPNGHYSVASGGFNSSITNGPLTALANGTSANGVFAYGSTTNFPTGTWNASNYFVDVLFVPAPVPDAPSDVSATAGRLSATVSWTAPTGGGPVESYVVTPYLDGVPQATKTVDSTTTTTVVSGLSAAQSYTFTVRAANMSGAGPESAPSAAVSPTSASAPSAPTHVAAQADAQAAIVRWSAPEDDGGNPISEYTITPHIDGQPQTSVDVSAPAESARITGLTVGETYTFTVKAKNEAGTGPASDGTGPVTPALSLFSDATPVTVDSGDSGAINVGVKFQSDVAGRVTGVRFYKSAANTGEHVGTLYSADGGILAQGAFVGETASGWQAVTFASPVEIEAGTTYVASYHAPNGRYSVTPAAFGSGPFDNPPLRALANAVSRNGVYLYSASPGFPVNEYNSANYWVDVLFLPNDE